MRLRIGMILCMALIGCSTANVSSRAPAAQDPTIEIHLTKFNGKLPNFPVRGSYEFTSDDNSTVRVGCIRNIFTQVRLTVGVLRPNETPNDNTIEGSMKVEDMESCQNSIRPVVEGKVTHIKLSEPFRLNLFPNQFSKIEFAE